MSRFFSSSYAGVAVAPTRDSRHNGASFTPSSNVWESKKVATRRSQRGLQAIRSSARLSLRGGQERLPRTSAHALSRQRLRALRARSIPLHAHAAPGDVRSHSRLVIRRRNGGRTTALLRVNAHRDRSRADLTEKSSGLNPEFQKQQFMPATRDVADMPDIAARRGERGSTRRT
jgi:hypothetical protein